MFEFLQLAHPPLGPQPIRAARPSMRVRVTDRVGLPLPIIAYDLPWSTVDARRAAIVADALDELGVTVAALRCELGAVSSGSGTDAGHPAPSLGITSRVCPYRPDRYGLRLEDLTTAKIIDVRLAFRRAPDGRFNHSPEQMRRWDLRASRSAEQDKAFAGGMPATLWPPDVRSMDKLADKVTQLRRLAPAAAICLSMGTDAVEAGLPMAVQVGAEMVAIRADDWPQANGPQLAERVAHTRRWLDANEGREVSMIAVPPTSAGALDVVKLLALGATMVAVDDWCGDILNRAPVVAEEDWAAVTLGVPTLPTPAPPPEVETVVLRRRIERMAALVESTGVASASELGPQHLVSSGQAIPGVRLA